VGERQQELGRRARRLEYATTVWNSLEAVVAISTGLASHSLALVAFGLDSCVEVLASVVVLWHLGGAAEDVDAQVGRDRARRHAAELDLDVHVLLGREPGHAGDGAGGRPDQGEQGLLHRPLVQRGLPADRRPAQLVEERLERDPLAVEVELGSLAADPQHPQVAEHLALVGQQRGVAAVALLERLDLVGDLARQQARRLAAGEGELAAL